jgi:hypothetical protein
MKTLALAASLLLVGPVLSQIPRSLDQVRGALPTRSGSGELRNEEVIAGLKEALDKGAAGSVEMASRTDGFWGDDRLRIPFPQEAERMKTTLERMGMERQVREFELTMNRAAEEASKEALTVLLAAIKGMSVGDGFAILRGGERAATTYLQERTTEELAARFRPIVEQATSKLALANHWTPLATAYNRTGALTGAQAVEPDLDGYITRKALDGLFLLIAEEEQKIRKDPMARTSDLLRRVFGGG